jgi:hypothetical protein
MENYSDYFNDPLQVTVRDTSNYSFPKGYALCEKYNNPDRTTAYNIFYEKCQSCTTDEFIGVVWPNVRHDNYSFEKCIKMAFRYNNQKVVKLIADVEISNLSKDPCFLAQIKDPFLLTANAGKNIKSSGYVSIKLILLLHIEYSTELDGLVKWAMTKDSYWTTFAFLRYTLINMRPDFAKYIYEGRQFLLERGKILPFSIEEKIELELLSKMFQETKDLKWK